SSTVISPLRARKTTAFITRAPSVQMSVERLQFQLFGIPCEMLPSVRGGGARHFLDPFLHLHEGPDDRGRVRRVEHGAELVRTGLQNRATDLREVAPNRRRPSDEI